MKDFKNWLEEFLMKKEAGLGWPFKGSIIDLKKAYLAGYEAALKEKTDG